MTQFPLFQHRFCDILVQEVDVEILVQIRFWMMLFQSHQSAFLLLRHNCFPRRPKYPIQVFILTLVISGRRLLDWSLHAAFLFIYLIFLFDIIANQKHLLRTYRRRLLPCKHFIPIFLYFCLYLQLFRLIRLPIIAHAPVPRLLILLTLESYQLSVAFWIIFISIQIQERVETSLKWLEGDFVLFI